MCFGRLKMTHAVVDRGGGYDGVGDPGDSGLFAGGVLRFARRHILCRGVAPRSLLQRSGAAG